MSDDLMDDRRCTATAKGSGLRCKRPAIPGGTVCVMHGGAAPQVQAKAEERQVEAAADEALAQLWPGLLEVNAVRDPVDLLARTAGALEQMAEVVGKRVNELNGRVAAGEHLTQFRAEVVLLDRVLDKLLRAGDVMARLGLAERQVELQQGQAQLVTSAFMGALAVIGGLLPADRDAAVRAFLAGLGRGPEVLEGAAS